MSSTTYLTIFHKQSVKILICDFFPHTDRPTDQHINQAQIPERKNIVSEDTSTCQEMFHNSNQTL